MLAPEEQEVVDNMKKLLGKVEEMQKQRESLEKQLRDKVHSDDITTSLVVQEGDREVVIFANFVLCTFFLSNKPVRSVEFTNILCGTN